MECVDMIPYSSVCRHGVLLIHDLAVRLNMYLLTDIFPRCCRGREGFIDLAINRREIICQQRTELTEASSEGMECNSWKVRYPCFILASSYQRSGWRAVVSRAPFPSLHGSKELSI